MFKVRNIIVLVLTAGILCVPLWADAKIYKVVRDSQGRAVGLKDPTDNIFKRVLRAATFPRLRRRIAASTGFGPAITQRQMQAPATATQQASGLVDTATTKLNQVPTIGAVTEPVVRWFRPSTWKAKWSSLNRRRPSAHRASQ